DKYLSYQRIIVNDARKGNQHENMKTEELNIPKLNNNDFKE
ncbi:13932_t:CDS:1, partial [Racocetra fulgida]